MRRYRLRITLATLVLALLLVLVPTVRADGTGEEAVLVAEGIHAAGVRPGMTPAQVTAAVGERVYEYAGYDVHYALPAGTINVRYEAGRVSEVVARPMTWSAGPFQTLRGIRSGSEPGDTHYALDFSPPRQILRQYPRAQITVNDPGAGGGDIRLQFLLSGSGPYVDTYMTYRYVSFFCGYLCEPDLVLTLEFSLGATP